MDPAGRCHKRKGSLEMERKDFPSRFPRLPLPEMAGSDRDEPHCLPGFVDRAYLVFLSNYGPHHLLHLRTALRPTRVPLTPFEFSPPILSASVVGYEPQMIHHPHERVRFKWLRGDSSDPRAPTEVPIRARACHHLSPLFPWEGLTPQPCSPTGLRPRIRPGRFAWLVPIRRVPEPGAGRRAQPPACQSNSRRARVQGRWGRRGRRPECHRSTKQ